MRLKPYRVTIAVDIEAVSRDHAGERLLLLCGDLHPGRPWVRDALPDGIEERERINRPKKGE